MNFSWIFRLYWSSTARKRSRSSYRHELSVRRPPPRYPPPRCVHDVIMTSHDMYTSPECQRSVVQFRHGGEPSLQSVPRCQFQIMYTRVEFHYSFLTRSDAQFGWVFLQFNRASFSIFSILCRFSRKFRTNPNQNQKIDKNYSVCTRWPIIKFPGLLPVSEESIRYVLEKTGVNSDDKKKDRCSGIIDVVGGSAESLDVQPGRARLTLKKRTGFLRIAIETGADLVPIFTFGENELFEQVSSIFRLFLTEFHERCKFTNFSQRRLNKFC